MNLSSPYHDLNGRPLPTVTAANPAADTGQQAEPTRTNPTPPEEPQPPPRPRRINYVGDAMRQNREDEARHQYAKRQSQLNRAPRPTADPPSPPPAPSPGNPTLDEEKRQRRHTAALKAAATVRKQKHDAEVKRTTDEHIAQVVHQVVTEAKRVESEPPGTLNAKQLRQLAQAHGLEQQLYRFAHIERISWTNWATTDARVKLTKHLNELIASPPSTTKGKTK